MCVCSTLLGGRSPWKKQVAFRSGLGGSSRNKLSRVQLPPVSSWVSACECGVTVTPEAPLLCPGAESSCPHPWRAEGAPTPPGRRDPSWGWGLGSPRGGLGDWLPSLQVTGTRGRTRALWHRGQQVKGRPAGSTAQVAPRWGQRCQQTGAPARRGPGRRLSPKAASTEASARGKSYLLPSRAPHSLCV